MAIQAVNIFTKKPMMNYDDYSPQKETIQDSSVATVTASPTPQSELQNFIDNEIAHIYGYSDADSLLDSMSSLPKGRSLSGISCKWIKTETSSGPSAKLSSLNSFNAKTDEMLASGKSAGAEEIKKKLEEAQKELKELQSQKAQKEAELAQGYVMVTTTDKKGRTVLKKIKLKSKKNNGYNVTEWQNAINELEAKIRSKQQIIANYEQRLQSLSDD